MQEWVEDIRDTEERSLKAAEEGLKLLEDQLVDLEECSTSIIEAAKKQALLTIQYGVPYIPRGNSKWRDELETGHGSKENLERMAMLTSKIATVTGIPETIVNKAVESKTGTNPGGSTSEQLMNAVGLGGGEDKDEKEEDGDESAEAEKVEVVVEDGIELSEAVAVEESELPSESMALMEEFRPPKQPEEFFYENHRACFKFMLCLCIINIILGIVVAVIPGM